MVEVLGEDAGRPDHLRPEELHRPRPDHPSRVRKLQVNPLDGYLQKDGKRKAVSCKDSAYLENIKASQNYLRQIICTNDFEFLSVCLDI